MPAPGAQILSQLIVLELPKPKSIFRSLRFFVYRYTQIYIWTRFFFRIWLQDFEFLECILFCISTVIFPPVTEVRKSCGNKTGTVLLEKHDTEGGSLLY